MKNTYVLLLFFIIIFLVGAIYMRTPFFESSIATKEMTFNTSDNKTIVSTRYYVDMGGNWILLDKGVVIGKDDISSMSFYANIDDKN